VRFKKSGKIYYFDPDDASIEIGTNVIVETARGIEFGTVVVSNREVSDEDIISPLKKVIRVASEEDKKTYNENKKKQVKAFDICLQKIAQHKLDLKLIDVEYTFDNTKILFYFTADGRIDFRELVKDLAAIFKTRIELRQIGVRDETKMIGGMGVCGRETCCSSYLGEFQPVSIKMAKEQNLSLNSVKISGVCGRLMCCLKYEQDTYDEILKYMPGIEAIVETPLGKGVVIGTSVLNERVRVKVEKGDQSEVSEFDIKDIKVIQEGIKETDNEDIEVLKELEGLED
jgi:cell fate regulator YaaT (PSP1 superfamily)